MTSITPLLPQARRRGRPPKNSDVPRQDIRALLIRTGVAVLTEKGYSSVGIDEVLRAVQVPKGSFYYYFDSKEAFGQVLITAYADYFARKLDRWFLDTAISPVQRLRNFIQDATEGMARHDFRRGCLVGNLGQEMGTLPESFRPKLEQVFLDWQARTATCLAEAQRAKEIAAHHDCARLAQFFWIGWEGAVLRAKLDRSPTPLDVYAEGFFEMLRAKR
ncbi:TetR family transcriptional regulator [Acidovorax sp. 69]|uniref:acrylate utilization transcriptional regulator AcuR n=1 Tax=Acidovorax sp. 69 TaxID=2035202 RepID=UPI000C247A34|nr:TetR/AcrR family transcriptional regulator [Acidovorax sp. 69]PJI96125.1 TetR family transcriptional regulator [Acidovorax sp. 69]